MATLELLSATYDTVILVEHASGRLLDLCDDVLSPLVFSCRDGRCGTCRVLVLESNDRLLPVKPSEEETLARVNALKAERLACQVAIHPGPGRIRLRCVQP